MSSVLPVILTARCERWLLLRLHLLPTAGWDVVVDALVVVVHGDGEHLLGVRLANDVLVEVSVYLKQGDGEQKLHVVNKEDERITSKKKKQHFFPPLDSHLLGRRRRLLRKR